MKKEELYQRDVPAKCRRDMNTKEHQQRRALISREGEKQYKEKDL